MIAERTVAERIALIERKLEIRRERTQRHWRETRAHVERRTGWWPLVAAVGALVIGVAAGRPARPTPALAATTRKTGGFATLFALGATALRFALSPGGRALWSAFRAGRLR
jgi:hypothetical protein